MDNGMTGTKLKIFMAAAELFAEEDYYAVSMRQIASAVGLKAASIYNHFESKEAILNEIYSYFDNTMVEYTPDLEDVLKRAEYEHPHSLLKSITFVFPEDKVRIMSQCMLVTSSMARYSAAAADIIYRNLIDLSGTFARPILERLIELGRIEPLNIDAFALVLSNYSYGSAIRFYMGGDRSIPTKNWESGIDLIISTVKVIEAK